MRSNKYGVRGLTSVPLKKGRMYFWVPPVSLQKMGIFRHKTLGIDFDLALSKARDWSAKLDAYRAAVNGVRPTLTTIIPGSVAQLVRQFEASPRYARYSSRARQDYSWMYRSIEVQTLDHDDRMFGEMIASEITRQFAYTLYEENVRFRGHDSANKAMCAWSSAFRYGMLRYSEITCNPFADLGKISSPPRRQRWTDQQLDNFISKAEELGFPSIGRCALMCMELVQRPGDILSLTWDDYHRNDRVWEIRQSKRGAVVRVSETRRLRSALNAIRRSLDRDGNGVLVCPTVTGKRWHRRNFTKAVRRIARAAGLSDDLQVRDLRRTAATEGASAGATPAEMMAVGGWANPASIQTREQAATFQAKRDAYRLSVSMQGQRRSGRQVAGSRRGS
jgi:integrase